MFPKNAVFFLHADDISGVTRVNLGLAKSFRDREINCSFLLTDVFQSSSISEIEGFPLQRLGTPYPRKWLCSHGLGIKRARKRFRRLLKEKLRSMEQTVIFPGYDISCSDMWQDFGESNRVVFVIHSDDPFYYHFLENDAKNAHHLVAVSQYLADKVQNDFPVLRDRVVHIPNGIEVNPWIYEKEALLDAPLRILFAGRIEQQQKQVFDIPKIMQRLEKAEVRYHLDIIGDGPDREVMEQMCSDLLVATNYTFHGRLSHENTLKLMNAAHVYLSTSAYEGLSMSLLEAGSQGCIPVVSKIKSGNDQVVHDGETGYLIEINHVEAYAHRLSLLAHQSINLKDLSIHIRKAFEKSRFTIESMGNAYIDFFKTIKRENV